MNQRLIPVPGMPQNKKNSWGLAIARLTETATRIQLSVNGEVVFTWTPASAANAEEFDLSRMNFAQRSLKNSYNFGGVFQFVTNLADYYRLEDILNAVSSNYSLARLSHIQCTNGWYVQDGLSARLVLLADDGAASRTNQLVNTNADETIGISGSTNIPLAKTEDGFFVLTGPVTLTTNQVSDSTLGDEFFLYLPSNPVAGTIFTIKGLSKDITLSMVGNQLQSQIAGETAKTIVSDFSPGGVIRVGINRTTESTVAIRYRATGATSTTTDTLSGGATALSIVLAARKMANLVWMNNFPQATDQETREATSVLPVLAILSDCLYSCLVQRIGSETVETISGAVDTYNEAVPFIGPNEPFDPIVRVWFDPQTREDNKYATQEIKNVYASLDGDRVSGTMLKHITAWRGAKQINLGMTRHMRGATAKVL